MKREHIYAALIGAAVGAAVFGVALLVGYLNEVVR